MIEHEPEPTDETELRRRLSGAAAVLDPAPPGFDAMLVQARRYRRRRSSVVVAVAATAIAVAATAVAVDRQDGPRAPSTAPATAPPTRPEAGIVERCLHSGGVDCYTISTTVPAALVRQLDVPRPTGPACSATTLRHVTTPDFGGDAPVAPGPVRPVLAASVHDGAIVAVGTPHAGYQLKVLWFSYPRYLGPVLVRATRVDKGKGTARFDFGGSRSNWLVLPGAAGGGQSGRSFRTWPTGMEVPEAGCYALQVDGRDFSYVLIVQVLTAERP